MNTKTHRSGTLSFVARAASIVVVMCSTAVAAQGYSLDPDHPFLENPDVGQDVFNLADCAENKEVALQAQILATFSNALVFDVIGYHSDVLSPANSPCPDLNLGIVGQSIYKDDAVTLINVANGSGELLLNTTIPVRDLLGDSCDAPTDDPAYEVCFYLREFDDINQPILFRAALDPALLIDTQPPAAPTINASDVGDGRITLSWTSNDTDDDRYGVQYRPCTVPDAGVVDDGGVEADGGDPSLQADSVCGATTDFVEVEFSGTSAELTGLKNGQDYELRVRSFDDVGNPSEPSDAVVIAPKAEDSSLDLYDGTPNSLSLDPQDVKEACDSCDASSGPSPIALLALLLLVMRRRRRVAEGITGASLMLLLLSFANPAAAELGQLTVRGSAAPTSLAIDNEVGPNGKVFPVYECIFAGQTRPEFGLDAGIHLFDGLGSLQLTVGLGAFQVKGTAQPIGQSATGCTASSEGTRTELTVVKVGTGLRYEADMLLEWFNIPLVPYIGGSLLAGGYAFTTQGTFDRNGVSKGNNPVGARLGVEASLGLMLELSVLNFLDPTKRGRGAADAISSFEHAYLFADVTWQRIDSFSPGLILSPDDRLFGTRLPLLFKVGVAMELP